MNTIDIQSLHTILIQVILFITGYPNTSMQSGQTINSGPTDNTHTPIQPCFVIKRPSVLQ